MQCKGCDEFPVFVWPFDEAKVDAVLRGLCPDCMMDRAFYLLLQEHSEFKDNPEKGNELAIALIKHFRGLLLTHLRERP